jgi:hypothetical protein
VRTSVDPSTMKTLGLAFTDAIELGQSVAEGLRDLEF